MSATLFAAFLDQVRSRPGAIALVAGGEVETQPSVRWTWAELAERVAACMLALQSRELFSDAEGCCVAYLHRNCGDDVCVALAVMGIGATEVPIDARGASGEVAQLRRRVGGRWLEEDFVSEAMAMRGGSPLVSSHSVGAYLESFRYHASPQAPALVLWTTGTTGEPKGVMLSHQNLFGNAQAKLQAVPQSKTDVRLTTLPLSHAYARTCDFGTWLISGSVLALSLGYRGWETLAEQVQPTHANVVPALAERLLHSAGAGQQRLKVLGCGGAPLSGERFERFRERGVTVIQGYGLTEASPVVCSATAADARPGWVGCPVPGWETDVRDGRLFVRGNHVMLGYWGDPLATRHRIDEAGWLDTADLVERDSESGQFRIVGRADDLLVLPNGNKLHPRPMEGLIEELPNVAHAMVLLNHGELELWFDRAVASATGRAGDELSTQITDRLATYPRWMQPKRVREFAPPLSRDRGELSIKGTIRRQAILRQRFANQAGS